MGVGGKRVAGLGGLGGMGERWKIDGRRRKVAGRACPAPTDCCFRQRGFGGTPEFKVEEGAGALRTKSNTAFV